MAKRRTSRMRDIARESGTSVTAVSLILNRREHRISAQTCERVMEVARRLGYRPSRLAQGLKSRRTGILAILLPELQHVFADVYFGELISAIHDFASAAGYKILMEVAHPPFIEQRQHLELFDCDFVDGMLCLGISDKDAYMEDFRDGLRPVVVVNNAMPGLPLNFVRCDYREAGRLAARALLEQGHREIGLIHGAPEVYTSVEFRTGVEEVLEAAGCPLRPQRLADGLYTDAGGADAAGRLLERDRAITGLIAGNDKMAIGAFSAVKQHGLRIPADISVVGCDDIPQAAYTDPPLSTVHTPLYEIGRQACRRLLEIVDGAIDSVQEIHPVTMTLRGSIGPARHA